MDLWTQEDERQLLALQVRRKVTHEANAERLMTLVKRVVPVKQGTVSDVSIYDLRTAMIEHGGEFRDADCVGQEIRCGRLGFPNEFRQCLQRSWLIFQGL